MHLQQYARADGVRREHANAHALAPSVCVHVGGILLHATKHQRPLSLLQEEDFQKFAHAEK